MSKTHYEIAGHHYLNPGDTAESLRYVALDVRYKSGKDGSGDYAAWEAAHERLLHSFRVVSADIIHQAADGDLIMTHWKGKLEHVGPFMGIAPTGRIAALRGFGVDIVKDGKVVEHWGLQDALGLIRQLEA